MQVIDQINGSALFAQSAYSASVATKDNLGRDITATYLTSHQDISNLMPKSESANFYPMEGNPSGFLTTHQDLSDYQTTAGMTAYQEAGDYYSASNPSGFITGVDLTPYQTIEGMTAYQPAGSYATTNELEQVSADITATIPSTAGLASESYVQTNSAVLTGMIDGKQDTLTFGYDEQDRINSINNSALAGGGDVPEDVMVETNLEYNAVNEISGYNGSAIAQYGAEKQWLVHDDTLVHAANSAQYALGVNLSAVAQLLGVDETVLFQSTGFEATSCDLSEAPKNFERLKFWLSDDTIAGKNMGVAELYSKFITSAGSPVRCAYTVPWNPSGFRCISVSAYSANDYKHWVTNGYQWWGSDGGWIEEGYMKILKVVGVHRISG